MNSPSNFQQVELSDIRINLEDTMMKKSTKRSNMIKDNNSKMINSGIP